jgi:hypothetical protein
VISAQSVPERAPHPGALFLLLHVSETADNTTVVTKQAALYRTPFAAEILWMNLKNRKNLNCISVQ